MFRKLLIFMLLYFGGAVILCLTAKYSNIFHFSVTTYAIAFLLGIWDERWERKDD